jgi:prepilin-type N-terminal cleavage/methylation domain-containing protein
VYHKGEYIMNRRGFTLVELMIVIAIIAILAAVVIPMINGKEAHGAELGLALVPTDSVLKELASTLANDPTQIVTVLIYSATWSADSNGFEQIEKFLDERNRVMVALVRLGVPASRMNILLANEGGLDFDNLPAPEKDGVYVFSQPQR